MMQHVVAMMMQRGADATCLQTLVRSASRPSWRVYPSPITGHAAHRHVGCGTHSHLHSPPAHARQHARAHERTNTHARARTHTRLRCRCSQAWMDRVDLSAHGYYKTPDIGYDWTTGTPPPPRFEPIPTECPPSTGRCGGARLCCHSIRSRTLRCKP